MTLQFSRRLAILAGIVLPLGETARRWHELGDPAMWLVWLDDWAIAAFLLFGAWRTRRDVTSGRPILAAAWGFACGLGYSSFVFSILSANPTDASGAPMRVAAAVKGVMLLLGIAGLAAALRAQRQARSTAPTG
jgi:hypothetical protein